MTDALDAAVDAGPQTDALVEQVEAPRPAEVKVERQSLDDALKAEVEKALAGDKPKAEPEAEEKAEAKAEKGDEKDAPKAEPKEPPKKPAKAEKPQDDQPEPEATEKATNDAPKKPSAYRDPPSGFDDAAKAEWEAVPESVRGAMHRRTQEMERGIEKYRAAAQEFEPVRQYAEMARQSGTTLDQALSRYVAMEQLLRQDPMAGLQSVVANLGLKRQDGSPVTLRDIAASIMGQTPDQTASRQEATISRLTQQVQQLTQQLGGVSRHFEQQQEQAKVSAAQTTWDTFQRENPRAKELEPQIAEFLTKYPAPQMPVGERLRDAYNWAVAQSPSVAHTDVTPLVQTQTQAPPNPAGQKSVSGAGGESRAVRKMSSDDAIKRAIAKLSG